MAAPANQDATFRQSLQLFYFQTDTPDVKNYLDDPRIILILDAFRSPSQAERLQCAEVVHFILRLVDTPDNLDSVLALKPCTLYLIHSAASQLKLVPEEDKQRIINIATKFYHIVETSSQPTDKMQYLSKPLIEGTSIARFHYDSHQASLLPDSSFPLYIAYGFLLHRRIRHNSQLGLDDKTVEDYIRSARYFFMFLPDKYKSSQYHPSVIPTEYIDAFISEYNYHENRSYLPLTARATSFKKTFNRLIDRWVGKPVSRLGYIPEDELESVDGEVEIFGKEDAYYENAAVDLNDTFPQAQEEPFPDIELGFIKKHAGDTVSKKPQLTRQWSDLVNLRSFHFPWDAKHLNLYHYAMLYQELGNQDHYCHPLSKTKKMIIFLMFLIHTGIDCKRLLSLYASDTEAPPDDRLILRNINGRYYIRYNSFVIRKEEAVYDHCYQAASVVHIPIPPELMDLFPSPPEPGSVFAYQISDHDDRHSHNDPDEMGTSVSTEQLTVGDIKSFLHQITNGRNANYRKRGLRITPSKITASFLTLYSARCGMDEIMATYICGHDYHRLYGSQAHYIHIPHDKLEDEYFTSFYAANKLIIDNYHACIEHDLFYTFKQTPKLLEHLINIRPQADQASDASLSGYGSPCIVKDGYLFDIISKIKKHIEREPNFIQRHNLYICYAYLALQFNTGLRPRNNPNITWENLNDTLGIITIRDKASVAFHEVRTVPLANNVIALLRNIRTSRNKLLHFIARNHYPSIFREDLSSVFFFIDGKGKCVDFDLDTFTSLIKSIVPDYNLPANMPRHYLRNYLYHAGIGNDLADAIFGHQHHGKELLNVISSSKPCDVSTFVLPAIERMLKQLGIEEIRYA